MVARRKKRGRRKAAKRKENREKYEPPEESPSPQTPPAPPENHLDLSTISESSALDRPAADVSKQDIRPKIFAALIIFLIVAVSVGALYVYVKNRDYFAYRLLYGRPADFEIAPAAVTVVGKSNETATAQIELKNTGEKNLLVSGTVNGISSLAAPNPPEFGLGVGQSRTVDLIISLNSQEQKKSYPPGVYTGELKFHAGKSQKTVPLIVEVESPQTLFDVTVSPVALDRKVAMGSPMLMEIKIFDIPGNLSEPVTMEYKVTDMGGRAIISETQKLMVSGATAFFKTIPIPHNIRAGTYVFTGTAVLGNSVGTASYVFEVVSPQFEAKKSLRVAQFCRRDSWCTGVSTTAFLLLLGILGYGYFLAKRNVFRKMPPPDLSGALAVKEWPPEMQELLQETSPPKPEFPIENSADAGPVCDISIPELHQKPAEYDNTVSQWRAAYELTAAESKNRKKEFGAYLKIRRQELRSKGLSKKTIAKTLTTEKKKFDRAEAEILKRFAAEKPAINSAHNKKDGSLAESISYAAGAKIIENTAPAVSKQNGQTDASDNASQEQPNERTAVFGQRALPPVIIENRSTHHKKCWKHIRRAHGAFQKGRLKYARRRYLAAREAYLKLEYYEKKELYPHLEELHNALQHGQHPPV